MDKTKFSTLIFIVEHSEVLVIAASSVIFTVYQICIIVCQRLEALHVPAHPQVQQYLIPQHPALPPLPPAQNIPQSVPQLRRNTRQCLCEKKNFVESTYFFSVLYYVWLQIDYN